DCESQRDPARHDGHQSSGHALTLAASYAGCLKSSCAIWDRYSSRRSIPMANVNFEIEGSLAIVTIARPEARNAVDHPTAVELAALFRKFDADSSLSVAILTGQDGYFCAGADLKAVATGRGNRVTADGDGPLGCTRMLLSKPV